MLFSLYKSKPKLEDKRKKEENPLNLMTLHVQKNTSQGWVYEKNPTYYKYDLAMEMAKIEKEIAAGYTGKLIDPYTEGSVPTSDQLQQRVCNVLAQFEEQARIPSITNEGPVVTPLPSTPQFVLEVLSETQQIQAAPKTPPSLSLSLR